MKDEKLVTEAEPLYKVLGEVLRHYTEYRALVTNNGSHVIEHSYIVYNEDGTEKSKETVEISFWDLHNVLASLPKRKREAVYFNVILDKKQKEVGEIMNITPVSVGQYVKAALIQVAKEYFNEEEENDESSV